MGEVYRARDTRLDRTVALKVLPSAFSSDSDRLQRFQYEARILSTLNHSNVLAIHDVGDQNGIRYLVSEFSKVKRCGTRWRPDHCLGAACSNMRSKSQEDWRRRTTKASSIAI